MQSTASTCFEHQLFQKKVYAQVPFREAQGSQNASACEPGNLVSVNLVADSCIVPSHNGPVLAMLAVVTSQADIKCVKDIWAFFASVRLPACDMVRKCVIYGRKEDWALPVIGKGEVLLMQVFTERICPYKSHEHDAVVVGHDEWYPIKKTLDSGEIGVIFFRNLCVVSGLLSDTRDFKKWAASSFEANGTHVRDSGKVSTRLDNATTWTKEIVHNDVRAWLLQLLHVESFTTENVLTWFQMYDNDDFDFTVQLKHELWSKQEQRAALAVHQILIRTLDSDSKIDFQTKQGIRSRMSVLQEIETHDTRECLFGANHATRMREVESNESKLTLRLWRSESDELREYIEKHSVLGKRTWSDW